MDILRHTRRLFSLLKSTQIWVRGNPIGAYFRNFIMMLLEGSGTDYDAIVSSLPEKYIEVHTCDPKLRFLYLSLQPSGISKSYFRRAVARIILISFAAKNLPGQAFLPYPKARLVSPTLANWLFVAASVNASSGDILLEVMVQFLDLGRSGGQKWS